MVLKVNAETRPPREEIDALCDLAVHCLDGPSVPSLFEGEPPFSAISGGLEEDTFFVRSLSDPSDALILVVPAHAPQKAVWAAAQVFLDKYSGNEAPA